MATPDDLDILVTAKNHDVKQAVALGCAPDDWMLALVDLQTMAGFLGAGNYGIARMNGGFSARPCLGLAPADAWTRRASVQRHAADAGWARVAAGRPSGLFRIRRTGLALLWLEPWDGRTSLDLRELESVLHRGLPKGTTA